MQFNVPAQFNRFIGIDWSGAEGRTPSLRAYECLPGNACPTPIVHPNGWNWNRTELVNHIIHAQQASRLLVGVDFAFAYPFCDSGIGCYFPQYVQSPCTASDLWAAIEQICANDPDFYGDQLYNGGANSRFASYFCTQAGSGPNYEQRFRVTEQSSQAQGTPPGCTFRCVGPSVGCGTASGIRVLNYLKLNNAFEIWPFYIPPTRNQSVIVEVYPTFFFAAAGGNRQYQNITALNAVLSFYGSLPVPAGVAFNAQDPVDALVSAAALRNWAGQPNRWNPQTMTPCAQTHEGWIFGVL